MSGYADKTAREIEEHHLAVQIDLQNLMLECVRQGQQLTEPLAQEHLVRGAGRRLSFATWVRLPLENVPWLLDSTSVSFRALRPVRPMTASGRSLPRGDRVRPTAIRRPVPVVRSLAEAVAPREMPACRSIAPRA